MFTLLPPGSRLGAHRDPFAGSLRYHLGLMTPNSPECYIIVDGQKYYWKDGEAVMFDETYIHQAENRTDVTRVILFCDIERPLSNPVLRWINRTIGRGMIRAAATQNVAGRTRRRPESYIFLRVSDSRARPAHQGVAQAALLLAEVAAARGARLRHRCRILKQLFIQPRARLTPGTPPLRRQLIPPRR